MRFRLKQRTWWIVIAVMLIAIVILCKACFASSSKKAETDVNTTTTTIATAEEVKQEEDIGNATEKAVEEEKTTEEPVEEQVEESNEKAAVAESEAEKEINQFTVDDPDATDLIAYLGERPVNMQELPTFESYLKSQEKAFIINYKGTNHWENNDSRRLYFKVPVESITEEYEDDGQIRESTVELEEIEPGLIRATPIHSTEGRTYVTFKINSDGKIYYMTWVPLIE